jgi:O-methyltransferase
MKERHILQDVRTASRRLLERAPLGKDAVLAYQRTRRVNQARGYLEAGQHYPGDREDILRDFGAVCLNTQLTVAGILNLEALARDVIERDLRGAFVECGTWRGGALGFWARSFMRNGGKPEGCALFGFDSFEGMPQMTGKDGDWTARWLYGRPIDDVSPEMLRGSLTATGRNLANEADCWSMLEGSAYPRDRVTIAKGWFQDVLPSYRERIGPIGVLRLDGDFYESTRTCLMTLYDQVVPGGAIIIDDYGMFPGCKTAVDEFLAERAPSTRLIYVDVAVRFFFKS